jgi:hypothetical protein
MQWSVTLFGYVKGKAVDILAEWSEVWTAFSRSNTETVGSNITQHMHIYVVLFRVCIGLHV